MAIKRIKFFDVLQEQNDDIDKADVAAKIDADFALMAGELNRLINDLFGQFSLNTNQYLDDK
jgi:recombination associated protein RdgC